MSSDRRNVLAMLGPGLLVAATGVGAGDLATGALTGEKLGVAVLWAVVVGAGLKYVLNEGLARWQLATSETLLEGVAKHIGAAAIAVFLMYLMVWTFLVALALMSACGVVTHAILPLSSRLAELPALAAAMDSVLPPEPAARDKVLYGIAYSALAVVLVRWGGYRLFEKVMRVCIAIMFVVVVITAIALRPAWSDVLQGLFFPTIPQRADEGVQWTVALMGGVGGTVTVLCYGYWIREEQRRGVEELRACRIDLAAGYMMTAIFGIGMVIIGSRIDVEGGGSTLMVKLADRLHESLGPAARWAFLAGAWGAVFSSLLGVWQSVPYLFADVCLLLSRKGTLGEAPRPPVDTASRAYRWYLYGMASLPAIGLFLIEFRTVQKTYAILGAAIMPILAAVLLVLCGHGRWIGTPSKNSLWTNALLAASILLFLAAAVLELW